MAFQKGLGAAHALAHALTPISGVHHGLANAVVLPSVMTFNQSACAARLARVAVAMGESKSKDEAELSSRAIQRTIELNRTIGIPARLRDVGVKESDLPKIAEKAFQDASHRTNPRPTSQENLLSIARAAF